MEVSRERLKRDIETNAEFGAVDVEAGHGRTVLAGTEANQRAREYFVERLREADLDVSIDAVGNVVGRYTPDDVRADAPAVAAGSHLDSVPEGGIFDGPLGVYAALEAVRAIEATDVELSHPLEVVCFTEEEGQRFGGGLVGSAVAAGDLSVEDALALADDDGITLGDALAAIGFDGDGRIDASEWAAWFEVHVEQGERLETAGVPVGVVTAITGLARGAVTIRGEANHAGTTSMHRRNDALTAASEFVLDVERAARDITDESPSAVGTVGKLAVGPNAPNVVPGTVDLSLDVRDVEYASMEAIFERAAESLGRLERERDVSTSLDRPWDQRPTPMSERCRAAIHEAGARTGIDTTDLHSGAGHDTMNVASVADAGLLFAPSRDGISHNPLEWTDWEDCAAVTHVLAEAMASVAGPSETAD